MKMFTALAALLLLSGSITADDKKTPDKKADQTKAAAKVEVGAKAPDFTVTGIDGKEFKLSDKLKGGKKNIVLLFSRAHW